MNGIRNQKQIRKRILYIAIAAGTISMTLGFVRAENDPIAPHKADYGYYTDTYKKNDPTNNTPESNPSIGVLEPFLKIFRPGTDWKNGKIVDEKVQKENLKKSEEIAGNRTFADINAAYLDDRRDISYSILNGLGVYEDEFKNSVRAETTIPKEIPADSVKKLYQDKGNANGTWADENSSYGDMVALVNTMRSIGAETTSAKSYYKYMRPFRWSDRITLIDSLAPLKDTDPAKDYGFPSGHTNAAYITAFGLGYAMPEQLEQLLMRASDLGNNRIVAGRHSCLDVMGGRIVGTAVAASALNDPANKQLKEKAYESARELIQSLTDAKGEVGVTKQLKEQFRQRLTYGMSPTGDQKRPMVVPKGAEVLLETRLPYLTNEQRRYVLYTTGLESGYPLLDDTEGWGRLNLMKAIDGYGAFVTDVTVTMDASKGGFHAFDNWKNDIKGTGRLTKMGSGTLILSGKNTFAGGCEVKEGVLDVANESALGKGAVVNEGRLEEHVNGDVAIKGDFSQKDGADLALEVGSKSDIITIDGEAELNGRLTISFKHGYVPERKMKLIAYKSRKNQSVFEEIKILGYEDTDQKKLVYEKDGVYLENKK